MMVILYILALIVPAMILGILIGTRLRPQRNYDGVIKMIEKEGTLIYSLELAGDPELLVFQKEVRFKVIPPNYEELEDLLSQ